MFDQHLAYLANLDVEVWHAGKTPPGDDVRAALEAHIHSAHLILVFVTAALVASRATEGSPILSEWHSDHRRLIPVYARACQWTGTSFWGLQPIPSDGRPIFTGTNLDDRLRIAAMEVEGLVAELRRAPKQRATTITVMNPDFINKLVAYELELHDLHERLRAATAPTVLASEAPNVLASEGLVAKAHLRTRFQIEVTRLQKALHFTPRSDIESAIYAITTAADRFEVMIAASKPTYQRVSRDSPPSDSPQMELPSAAPRNRRSDSYAVNINIPRSLVHFVTALLVFSAIIFLALYVF